MFLDLWACVLALSVAASAVATDNPARSRFGKLRWAINNNKASSVKY